MIDPTPILAFRRGGRGALGIRGPSSVGVMGAGLLVATLALRLLADRGPSHLPTCRPFSLPTIEMAGGTDGGT